MDFSKLVIIVFIPHWHVHILCTAALCTVWSADVSCRIQPITLCYLHLYARHRYNNYHVRAYIIMAVKST